MSRRRIAALLTSLAIGGSALVLQTAPTASAAGFVVSEAQFNQMFPNRNSFYSYSGLTAALSAYP
ncbi:chitinase, partial [Streptomyces sp. NPDC054804]